MGASFLRAAAPEESQRLELPLRGSAPRVPTTFHSTEAEWILPLIAAAIDATLPRKEAAYLLGTDQSSLTKQLKGELHLSVFRMGALPEKFWLALADALREHYGLLDKATLIEQGEALIDRGRQMLAKAAQR
jgi:hypothetical protein